MSEMSNSVVYLTEAQAISVGINPAAYKGDVAMPNIHAGTVEVGDADSDVSVTVTGAYPDYYLNFVLPPADDGVTPNFTIGNVTAGATPSATVTGTPENPILNLVLPIPDVPYITEEAEGSIVTIEDAAAAQALSAVSYIEPVQAGEGEPSPANIRPITGHEGCEMVRAGKNLVDISSTTPIGAVVCVVDGNTVRVYSTSDGQYRSAKIPVGVVRAGVTYTLSATVTEIISGSIVIGLRSMNSNSFLNKSSIIFTEPGSKTVTFTPDSDIDAYVSPMVTYTTSEAGDATFANIQLEIGSTATEYEPYRGTTHTATFPQTVYGGSYDFVSGKLTVDRGFIESYAGETLPGPWISSMDVYQAGAVPTTGAQVCYELASPLTYDLTPQQVDMLFGLNNVWSDTGTTTINYIADTKEYVDNKVAMLVDSRKEEYYSSIDAIATLIRGGDVEANKKLFPIGDQIVIPWKDMDDANHNTDETAYQVPLDIVYHGEVTLESGEVVPGMFVQWHYTTPYGVQFSHQQAFLECPEGLVAGTYYVTFGETWGNAIQGESWNFTLTQAVPAGGCLSGFERMPDVATTTWQVKSWGSNAATDPIETVSVVSGATGTNLGVMPYAAPDEESGLNSMQRTGCGHNRWDTSALRQYLNASETDWWTPQEDYDIRPDQYNKTGFMAGFGDDFLAAIKPVKVTTALNTVEGYAEATVDTYDTFFLPSLEQMNVVPQLSGAEGEYWPYWRSRLGVSAPVAQSGTYPNLITTAINAQTSPQYVRLRSASRGNSCYAWSVNVSGLVYYYYASHAHPFSPVCVIC